MAGAARLSDYGGPSGADHVQGRRAPHDVPHVGRRDEREDNAGRGEDEHCDKEDVTGNPVRPRALREGHGQDATRERQQSGHDVGVSQDEMGSRHVATLFVGGLISEVPKPNPQHHEYLPGGFA